VKITEIRIKLMENSEDRLRAFCSITFDGCFVVRDLKIIQGNDGLFVAMPSRKLTTNCGRCRSKNHLKAKFCNQCGHKLPRSSLEFDGQGRPKLYADVAHPVNAQCREIIQNSVIEEFEAELDRASLPGYASRYDEAYDTDLEFKIEGLKSAPTKHDSPRNGNSEQATHREGHEATHRETTDSGFTGSEEKPGDASADHDDTKPDDTRLDSQHSSPQKPHEPDTTRDDAKSSDH